jgi:2-oxo-3-hexenedioate decarboxylase
VLQAFDIPALAHELAAAYASRQVIPTPPSLRGGSFDLAAAYAVEAELVRMRRSEGHTTLGRKVGHANKAVWRALKLETLTWARMYDDTVRYAENDAASLSMAPLCSPRLEPEIVFKLKRPPESGAVEPGAVLDAVEWIALGFEIVDCVYADWTFEPSDFVAAFGLHAALVVGTPLAVTAANIPHLVDVLPRFTVDLQADGQSVAQGSGKNSLKSPVLCLGELASAIARRADAEPLAAGELVSSGSLTESQPIAAGATWRAELEGIELPALTLRTTA